LRQVVIDANVLVSFFVDRIEQQRDAADELLQQAENGEIAAIVPQFVVFEMTYVLQSQYAIARERLTSMIRDVLTFPGVRVIDDCPWKRVLEVWPDPLPSLADAALVAIATANRYDAVATFDRKLANRLNSLGVTAYW
jgi:predicted nucleic acid-binding protein